MRVEEVQALVKVSVWRCRWRRRCRVSVQASAYTGGGMVPHVSQAAASGRLFDTLELACAFDLFDSFD